MDWFCASYTENWEIGFTEGPFEGTAALLDEPNIQLYSQQSVSWWTEWHLGRVQDQLIRFTIDSFKFGVELDVLFHTPIGGPALALCLNPGLFFEPMSVQV